MSDGPRSTCVTCQQEIVKVEGGWGHPEAPRAPHRPIPAQYVDAHMALKRRGALSESGGSAGSRVLEEALRDLCDTAEGLGMGTLTLGEIREILAEHGESSR